MIFAAESKLKRRMRFRCSWTLAAHINSFLF
jgi:hypothetical protein